MAAISGAIPVRPAYNPAVTTLNRLAATALIISLIAACALVPWVASSVGATLTFAATVVFAASVATTLLSATAALISMLYHKYKASPPPLLPVALPPAVVIPADVSVVPVPATLPPPPPPPPVARPISPPPSSAFVPAASFSSATLESFSDVLSTLRSALGRMRALAGDAPAIGVGQSCAELRLGDSWVDVPSEEVSSEADQDSEDIWSFPELFVKATTSLHSLLDLCVERIWGGPETAIRVKASKYEALLQTINGSLNEVRLPLVSLPERPAIYTLDYLDAIRNLYVETLARLRHGEEPGYHKVCSDLYTQPDLSEENGRLLSLLSVRPVEAGVEIWEYLRHVCHTLNHAPAELTTAPINRIARSIKDWRGLKFSPLNAGNPPQDLVHLRLNDFPIKVLGMGSPTLQGWNPFPATIDPIFEKHLQYLRTTGQKHFYVSNQNHKDEQVRNKEIMSLQERYPDVLVAITCAKNTSFYKGEGPAQKDEFENELYRQFFLHPVERSGCYLPPRLRDKREFQEWARQTIGTIATTFFGDKTTLSKEEKKFFIELFYNCLTLKIMVEEKISFINFTCKDGIDRGMGSLGWFLFLLLKNARLENSPEAANLFRQVFFTRAFWTRKRNIIEERFVRVAEDMEMLTHLDPSGEKARGLLSTLFPWLPNLHVEL